MINERLFQHYGIDITKDRGITQRCPRPFDTILIDKQGSCFACECQSWLPQSIGNLQVRTMDELLAGDMRGHLQSSITDGTYRYCNENQCTYLQGNSWPREQGQHIRHLRLAIDDSCNLRCPSCRNGLIFHKSGARLTRGKDLADKINHWLAAQDNEMQVHIGSDGDPFASNVNRNLRQTQFLVPRGPDGFHGWHCAANQFFLHGNNVSGQYFTNKDCRVTLDGNRGAIADINTMPVYIERLRQNKELPTLTCAQKTCLCGTCAPKSRHRDNLSEILKIYNQ